MEAFGWCVSVRFHKEPPTFDKRALRGHNTLLFTGYHHVAATSTFISSRFFSVPFTENLMPLISLFFFL